MIESIRFADIDEEPLIFEEESKSQNVSRENNSYRNLETARFSLTDEEKKEVRGLLKPGIQERKSAQTPIIKPQNVDQNRVSGQQKSHPDEKKEREV